MLFVIGTLLSACFFLLLFVYARLFCGVRFCVSKIVYREVNLYSTAWTTLELDVSKSYAAQSCGFEFDEGAPVDWLARCHLLQNTRRPRGGWIGLRLRVGASS